MTSEFKVLKVKFNSDCESSHSLFYKQNQNFKDQRDDKPRTLFVLNVPPYCNEESLKLAFQCFGNVEKVYLHAKPTSNISEDQKNIPSYFNESASSKIKGFKVAYVVFASPNYLQKAIKNPTEDVQLLTTKEKPVYVGMRKWINNYRNQFIDSKELQKEIDEFMKTYDENKTKEEEKAKESFNLPDEDGWITVTKAHKKAIVKTERGIEKLKTKEKKKRAQKQLVNFYTFQMRESKKEYIAQLRKKFEEDKKRIDLLKANRKFKPF